MNFKKELRLFLLATIISCLVLPPLMTIKKSKVVEQNNQEFFKHMNFCKSKGFKIGKNISIAGCQKLYKKLNKQK